MKSAMMGLESDESLGRKGRKSNCTRRRHEPRVEIQGGGRSLIHIGSAPSVRFRVVVLRAEALVVLVEPVYLVEFLLRFGDDRASVVALVARPRRILGGAKAREGTRSRDRRET